MIQLVIAQRGWLFVGDVDRNADEVTIRRAYCVRRWGTTAGIGELALKGPLPNTVLEPTGTVRIHVLAVVAFIDCEEKNWGII